MNDIDRKILDFEKQWWRYAGVKERSIRDLFDLNATAYYQRLNQLIDDPEAIAAEPVLTRRLAKLRASRQGQRRRLAAG